jgi:RimJ/RimL family protein N-acetyltransferase
MGAMDETTIRQNSFEFETSRLRVHHWRASLDDGPRLKTLHLELAEMLTPDVLQHLPPPLQITNAPNAIAKWVLARDAESDVFAVREQNSETLLGLLILVEFQEPGGTLDIHLGFLFAQTAWGKGYASELITGLVQRANTQSRPIQLLGGVAKTNPASARVLQKAGFERRAELSDDETDMFGMQSGFAAS